MLSFISNLRVPKFNTFVVDHCIELCLEYRRFGGEVGRAVIKLRVRVGLSGGEASSRESAFVHEGYSNTFAVQEFCGGAASDASADECDMGGG